MATVLITGNTYPVKEQIKALGGRWDPNAKGWRVPEGKAAAAQRLVSSAGPAPRYSSGRSGNFAPGRRKCPECGSRECSKAWNSHDLCDED